MLIITDDDASDVSQSSRPGKFQHSVGRSSPSSIASTMAHALPCLSDFIASGCMMW